MAKMTGARLFANMMQGYEVSHIFFVPAFMLKSFAEMEDMPIKRIMVHGEKAAADVATLNACRSKPGHSGAARRAGGCIEASDADEQARSPRRGDRHVRDCAAPMDTQRA